MGKQLKGSRRSRFSVTKTGANKIEQKIIRLFQEDRDEYLKEQFQKYIDIKTIEE
jgi:hypothetical protein